MIFTLPNFITLLRFPLALAFLQQDVALRVIALVLAALSDGLDGFLARRFKLISRFGTFLDPFADKFFVIVVLTVFLEEGHINGHEAIAMLCRDFAVFIFGVYLMLKGTLVQYQFRAILCGKVTTALQFVVMLGLTLHFNFPPYVFVIFLLLGIAALGELYLERKKLRIEN